MSNYNEPNKNYAKGEPNPVKFKETRLKINLACDRQ